MVTYVGSTIRVVEPSEQLIQWCRDNLTLANPDYYKKERMGLWTGRTPDTIKLWRLGRTTPSQLPMLEMPFGVFRDVQGLLEDVHITFQEANHIDYGTSIPLYDYQAEAVQKAFERRYGILQSPAGSGKGLPLCAKVYTPYGFTRNGDLQIGDEVLDAYGGTCKVTGIYDRGKQGCFKITFTDDTSIICDKDHLWQVRDTTKNNGWQVINTQTLFKIGAINHNDRRIWEIPITEPVHFEKRKVTIDPWLLGVLLGDGTFCNREVSISNTEQDIIDRVRQITNSPVYFRKDRISMIITDKGSLHYRLKDYGLQGLHSWEKFIPKDYIYNSVDVRLEVLRGLIDTDGSVGKGSNITITSTSRQLVEDCLEIVQSLGGTGRISTRHTLYTYNGEKKPGRESYRLSLKLYKFLPYSSEKHKRNGDTRTKYVNAYRKIKSIETTTPRETRCITVDSVDSLYLTDGFVVTHNTQMGLALIQRYGLKALWLTHTKDLLNQSKERAERYMNPELMGTITDGKVDIGKGITFATVQTMSRIDLRPYHNTWGVIIVDEGHRICASVNGMAMFQKVLNSLSCGHKYAVTATPRRADGLIRATFALIGRVVHTVPESAVEAIVEPVSVSTVYTDAVMPDGAVDGEQLKWAKLVNGLCADEARNRLIADKLIENRGYSCLILSDRLGHLETLMGLLPDDMRQDAVMISGRMTSKKGKAEREAAIEQMRTGDKKYLFASYTLAREGMDIPRLERLFLVTPQKDEAVIVQSLGRIARKFDGKAKPIAIDFVDRKIGILTGMYRKRLRIYREKGVEM